MSCSWKIAGAQIDCAFGNKSANLDKICAYIRQAAAGGARLVIFPECALTGYCFESKVDAWEMAEPIHGPSTQAIAALCQSLGIWTAFGLLERDDNAAQLFNACALLGPERQLAVYRKIHLPLLGVDRFTTPGNKPFAVHDLGGLRVGMNICYDGSFPESSRVLTLLGADLVILPTNWPTGARCAAQFLVPARAIENHIYYAAVNRVGEEGGFQFIGQSRVVDFTGSIMAQADEKIEEILYAEIDPIRAREKRIVNIPGLYEVDRVGDRRPEMYGRLCHPSNR